MAHFAKIDQSGIVVSVETVDDSSIGNLPFPASEAAGQEFLTSLYGGGTWVQTSRTGSFRARFAGKGYSYDANLDAFIEPKPGAGWIFDSVNTKWVSPNPDISDVIIGAPSAIADIAFTAIRAAIGADSNREFSNGQSYVVSSIGEIAEVPGFYWIRTDMKGVFSGSVQEGLAAAHAAGCVVYMRYPLGINGALVWSSDGVTPAPGYVATIGLNL